MSEDRNYSSLFALMFFLLFAPPALATDGGSAPPPPEESGDGSGESATSTSSATYYEATLGTTSADAFASSEPGVPAALAIEVEDATVRYAITDSNAQSTSWKLSIDDFARPHERVDATYDMILVLALPDDAGFHALDRGVSILATDGTPLTYGGEEIVLKRNHGLDKTLLASLIQVDVSNGGLPDLSDTGYRFTAWDAIVRYDPDHGSTVEARAELHYRTEPGVAAPDADDARLAAYLITWIPSLPVMIAPYAVRMDVVEATP